jgi:hypothetical protein
MREIERVEGELDQNTSKHIGLFVDNLEGLTDFQLNFKRDIILCKYIYLSDRVLFHPEMLSKS